MRPSSGGLALCAAAAAGVLAYAWWATGRSPFTTAATVAVVGAGLVAMIVGWTRPPRAEAPSVRADAKRWIVALAALAGWQLLAYAQHPRSEHPTLSSLTNAALESHTSRVLAFTAWLVLAARLARR